MFAFVKGLWSFNNSAYDRPSDRQYEQIKFFLNTPKVSAL